ncbi:hypothetical protein [Pseudonocardia oceani]|uniref:Uncharacterized protein n=2 Tax=Pseudonocardia oceani TaxID=2792013 RepID=A0ABS6U8T0_9PSEU|nr:hypothetical protein [Pseudonocardia oceani]MBW0124679.1 hypothetical protein [Pseudonocardia oceani]MBW0128554.1 hypothetical protein [Pseudonocardia oceani]
MTDDDRIAALFSEAASDTPPPGFDHDRVVAASRRITARRRSAVLGGAMALLVVTGVGVAFGLPGSGAGSGETTSAAAPVAAPEAAGGSAPGDAASEGSVLAESAPAEDAAAAPAPEAQLPEALRDQPAFTGAPLGPGTTECAQRQDPALRALVEEVLPETAGATEAAVTMDCRPGGERGVSLEVDDAGTPGLLTVEYLPPGEVAGATSGTSASSVTASGGTVVVTARGDGPGTPAPFEGRLDTAAAYLAPRL